MIFFSIKFAKQLEHYKDGHKHFPMEEVGCIPSFFTKIFAMEEADAFHFFYQKNC
jgi:hypothetical protein